MSKAILVMDMPESCLTCPFRAKRHDNKESCIVNGYKELGEMLLQRQEWCPLRSVQKEDFEKQIAKKPSFEGDGYWNGQIVYDTWICPCCDKRYEVDYEEYEHCPSCGQKIDWGD